MTPFSEPDGERLPKDAGEPPYTEGELPPIEEPSPEAGQAAEGFDPAEEESSEPSPVPRDPRDLWPRSPFYLRFPWILAGPLAAAMILWFGSGAVLSAANPAPRSGETAPTAAAPRSAAAPAATTVATIPPTNTPAPTPSVPALLPTYTPEATSTPRPTPTPFPMAVYNTDGVGVYLNRMAGGGERIKAEADRTVLQVVGEDQQMYGETWRHVRDPQGIEGWVPAQYLVDPDSLPALPPTATPRPATSTPTATATTALPATSTPEAAESSTAGPVAGGSGTPTPPPAAPATATPGATPVATPAPAGSTATPAPATTPAPPPSPSATP